MAGIGAGLPRHRAKTPAETGLPLVATEVVARLGIDDGVVRCDESCGRREVELGAERATLIARSLTLLPNRHCIRIDPVLYGDATVAATSCRLRCFGSLKGRGTE